MAACLTGCFSFVGGPEKDKSKNLPTPLDKPVDKAVDKPVDKPVERPTPLDKPVDPEFDSKNSQTPSTDEPVDSNDKTEKKTVELLAPLDEPVDPKIKLQEIFAQYRQDGKEDQLQESLKALFAKYDSDGNDMITRGEFRQVMEDLDVHNHKHFQLFHASDTDGSGFVDCEEFVRFLVGFAKKPM